MKRVSDIFDIWPSVADMGRDLDVSYPTVAAWKQRGSIPVAYWHGIMSAARWRGHPEVTAELLIEVHGRAAPDRPQGGFSEEAGSSGDETSRVAESGIGQFSRWKHLRRSHFTTTEEAVDHVRAMRSEWDRR